MLQELTREGWTVTLRVLVEGWMSCEKGIDTMRKFNEILVDIVTLRDEVHWRYFG
jgi:hypothetical protein